jgi:hypothetical protein
MEGPRKGFNIFDFIRGGLFFALKSNTSSRFAKSMILFFSSPHAFKHKKQASTNEIKNIETFSWPFHGLFNQRRPEQLRVAKAYSKDRPALISPRVQRPECEQAEACQQPHFKST